MHRFSANDVRLGDYGTIGLEIHCLIRALSTEPARQGDDLRASKVDGNSIRITAVALFEIYGLCLGV
jgi:hypothetical protein